MMNKFLNTKVLYIFISVIILIMVFLLVMRACSQKQPIQATVTPSDPVVGEEIFFFRFHVGSENLVLGVRKQRDIHTTQRTPSVQAKRGVQNTTDRQRKSGTLL